MDLLSKICIVEKNISLLIMRLIHQHHIGILNRQYYSIYSFNTSKQRMLYYDYIGCNYRNLTTLNSGDNSLFTIMSDEFGDPVEREYVLPLRYFYSSGMDYTKGYKMLFKINRFFTVLTITSNGFVI